MLGARPGDLRCGGNRACQEYGAGNLWIDGALTTNTVTDFRLVGGGQFHPKDQGSRMPRCLQPLRASRSPIGAVSS